MIGVQGFEHKRTSQGLLSVVHDGLVCIGEEVEIGANNTIAKGLMGRDTTVGDWTKTDCLVHIAHCVQIGQRCLIPASAMIAGSVTIGDDVWIGPNSTISSQVRIENQAVITLGAVVVRDVEAKSRVSGNFAMEHTAFIRAAKRVSQLLDHKK
jgi:UDP-3-O-[3-hydroxymyristoyl] glucosamine N-acyltransferase